MKSVSSFSSIDIKISKIKIDGVSHNHSYSEFLKGS